MPEPNRENYDVHARGCSKVLARPSQMLEGYDFCPECRRMILVK